MERLKFQKMLEDHRKLLYPGCENGLKKLGTTLELLQWKTIKDPLFVPGEATTRDKRSFCPGSWIHPGQKAPPIYFLPPSPFP